MSTLKLDPTIFNPTLYAQVTAIWLPGVDLRGEELDYNVLKRWFMLSGSDRDAFDGVCRARFAHALDAIGPDNLATPSAQPFLDEIERVATSENSSAAAWTALSLTLTSAAPNCDRSRALSARSRPT